MIAVDAPVLVELLTNGPRADAAEACLRQALGALEEMGVHYSVLESKSALRAGEMQRRQRQRGGDTRPTTDFLVGAHALLQCDALITYDTAFHRDYFKGLKLIVPKA